MVDIFDEVSDDLRGERTLRLLQRFGGLIIAAALLVVLGVAAQQGYLWHQTRQDNQAATQYLQITQAIDAQGDTPSNDQRIADARQLTGFAANAPAGYRTLSRLRAAGLYAAAGQLPQAATLWNAVSADTSADILLRNLADLMWAQQELGTAPNADIAARLQPLTGSQNPFHGLAQETQALLYVREGKIDQAKALFSQIASDPGAPDGVRNRADGLLAKLNG